VQERWEDTAGLLESIADLEDGLIHALSPA
jgi:hypothetical protein